MSAASVQKFLARGETGRKWLALDQILLPERLINRVLNSASKSS
jgi:hypothetical protein